MLITKVELDDIKSHRSSKYEFQPGTTAITGANGAGKTTIIEAIAWALFDSLEYKSEDFVRRGSKKGEVRVTFQSGFDHKLYMVYRDTNGKHYVNDVASNTRIHEQNKNVVGFMRQHLQLEPGANLKELYRAAIGVPQGTFTAVFLDNATTRKAVFDRLLKVEEYLEASKKLGDTRNLIKEKRDEVKLRLAIAENELKQFDQTEAEYGVIAIEIGALEQTLDSLKTEIAQREQAVQESERARVRLDQAAQNLRETAAARDNTIFQLANVERERRAAEIASARVGELTADYQIYARAEAARQTLEAERETRDRLKNEKNQLEKDSIDAKARQQFLNENLHKAQRAASAAIELAPQIEQEELLNAEHKTLLEARAEANAARVAVADLQTQIDDKRAEWKELSGRIKDGEKSHEAAARVVELEQTLKKADEDLTRADKAATSLDLLRRQGQDRKNELEKLRANEERVDREIGALEKFQIAAARVGSLAETETALGEKIANLRAVIELDQKFQREVKSGVCPILPDRCLNLREGERLKSYLTDKSTANVAALKKFESERGQIAVELKTAREAEKNTVKLLSLRDAREALRKQIAETETALANVRREIQPLAGFTAEKHNELRVEKQKIELELKTWREAALKFAALEGLRRQIQNLADEGKKLGAEQHKRRQLADRFELIEQQLADNQNRRLALDNPRARRDHLQREAARENEFKTQLDEIAEKIEKCEAARRELDNALEKFVALDDKLIAVSADLKRTQAARDEYLRNQTIAEKLTELNREFADLSQAVINLRARVEAAEIEHQAATANYNPENHQTEKLALAAAQTSEASANATLIGKRARAAQLAKDLERLNEVRLKLQDDLQEQERLGRVWETTDYIRDTLKQAAPHVGKIFRFRIAQKATEIFREITSSAGRSLQWTDEYEILLDEDGHKPRPFLNLSGGEQMAAALSIRLALLTELSDVRVAFFDEPTTNLDRERRERLAAQIGQIRNFNQLFVISHDDTFDANVENKIVVDENSAS